MPDLSLELATIDDIVHELARRGFHGVVAITKLDGHSADDRRGVSVLGYAPVAVGMADEAMRRARSQVDEDLEDPR